MDQAIQRLRETTVLYCEDEQDLRDVTLNLIRNFTKHQLIGCDGKEGLELFKAHKDEIDLIITDVNMPNMNGLDMTKEIKAINPDVPVIVATAFSNSEYLLEAIDIGVDKYVLKPIDMKKLIDTMSHSLAYRELRDLYRDSLTHLANRNALVRDLLLTPKDTLALIDIDKFSVLNDLYGEENGNEILCTFANMLLKYFSKDEYKLFRVGGDKFVVLAKDTSKTSDDLKSLCSGFIANLNAKGMLIGDNFVDINITIGIASADDDHAYEYAQRVVSYARRNFLSIMKYDEEIFNTKEDFEENIKWIKRLKDGMVNGQFKAYFQPIIDMKTSKIYKYESLVRYEDTDGSLVPPGVFLPVAKKAKLFPSIIKVMLNDVIKVIADKKVRVALNISFDDLQDRDTYDFIMFTLMMNPQEAKLLDFELLESEEIKDFELVKKFISEIRDYGCSIGVDDFGAGYSNFNMLEALKVDFVKIDGSLINQIDTNETQEIIVETIAGFAKKTNVKTVAEFVSNELIYEKVKKLGIDYGQGYYFDQPLPYDKVGNCDLGVAEIF